VAGISDSWPLVLHSGMRTWFPRFWGAISALGLNGLAWRAWVKLFTTLPTLEKSAPPSMIKAA
jgi:hypothetical protein